LLLCPLRPRPPSALRADLVSGRARKERESGVVAAWGERERGEEKEKERKGRDAVPVQSL